MGIDNLFSDPRFASLATFCRSYIASHTFSFLGTRKELSWDLLVHVNRLARATNLEELVSLRDEIPKKLTELKGKPTPFKNAVNEVYDQFLRAETTPALK